MLKDLSKYCPIAGGGKGKICCLSIPIDKYPASQSKDPEEIDKFLHCEYQRLRSQIMVQIKIWDTR